jgi:hypothetical protein
MLRHRHTLASFFIVFGILSAMAAQSALGNRTTPSTHRADFGARHHSTRLYHAHRRNRRHAIAARCARHATHASFSCVGHAAARHRSRKPLNTSLPAISGSAVQGQALSASTGSWTGQRPIHYSFQWQRDGANIAGASGATYILISADVGHRVSVIVTASNSAGSQAARSAWVYVTGLPAQSEAPKPTQREAPQPVTSESTGLPTTTKEAPEQLDIEEEPVSSKVEEPQTPPLPEGALINPAPVGPPAPADGWHIAFGDAFGAKLGYGPGEDNFWFTNKEEPANTDQPGLNSNELEVFDSNAVKVGPEGLELSETYTPNAGGSGKNYVGGLVNTAAHASGQQPFSWKSGGPTTWAFECVAKWPQNTGEADPGWWSDATVNGQENEIDFFEGFGWGKTWHTDGEWSATMPTVVGLNYHTVYGTEKFLGINPTEGFHRYTTTLTPNGSKTIVSEYIDGTYRWSFEVEYPANRQTFAHLILSYALREFPEGFQSGTRKFLIRSVAVYQDAAHAGQEIQGGGIAPGTTIG